MLRLAIGLALLPTAALTLLAAAQALGALAWRSSSALPFLGGLALAAAAWLVSRHGTAGGSGPVALLGGWVQRLYVLGHEFTHALAAWSLGAKVLGFKVEEKGGHVDLSHSNAAIALAPYCVPLYALFVVMGYRLWLALDPAAGGYAVFLVLMGLTLAFHMIETLECLWGRRQPDLAAAGGAVFSLALIGLANGALVLLLLKLLFPGGVSLLSRLRGVFWRSVEFWRWLYRFLEPLADSFVSQMQR